MMLKEISIEERMMMDKIAKELIERYDSKAEEANFISTVFKERSQLYGSLITLLLRNNLTSLTLNESDFKNAGNYMLLFEPHDNERHVTLRLMETAFDSGE